MKSCIVWNFNIDYWYLVFQSYFYLLFIPICTVIITKIIHWISRTLEAICELLKCFFLAFIPFEFVHVQLFRNKDIYQLLISPLLTQYKYHFNNYENTNGNTCIISITTETTITTEIPILIWIRVIVAFQYLKINGTSVLHPLVLLLLFQILFLWDDSQNT